MSRPYETKWPFPGTPNPGDTIRVGSMEDVTVTTVTEQEIQLDNGRSFLR
jgi:hypothetical protein